MTSRVYLKTQRDAVDSIDAAAFRQRLDLALDLARGAIAGMHIMHPDHAPDQRHALADLVRHETYYGGPGNIAATRSHHLIATSIAYSEDHRRDMLTIRFKGGHDRRGLTLLEPVAHDRFNALEPMAPADHIVAILARWRAWLDRLVLASLDAPRSQMDDDIASSLNSLYELLRAHGYDHEEAEDGHYRVIFGTPYRLPQITWGGQLGKAGWKWHPCFAEAGRAMLATVLPTVLNFATRDNASGLELALAPFQLEDQGMDAPLPMLDRMKALASLPDTGSADIIAPFPASR